MRQIDLQTPTGQKIWQQYVCRRTGSSDPLYVRHDALTCRIFGRPCSAREAVAKILSDICREGDRALLRYTSSIDGFRTTAQGLMISAAQRRSAVKKVPETLKRALQETAAHIRAFHHSQLSSPKRAVCRKGVRVYERRLPLDRVGIYVPGGVAPLVSTVLMNALPAQVAGVREIIMATPPDKVGQVSPALLYAADLAGVKTVYRLGGATAIGAMAYGTQSIPAVDKIVGPANIFGTEAKRQVVGQVGIDNLAGPSEILIIADNSAQPVSLAWDLLAQGEHGSGAVAILLTSSQQLGAEVVRAAQVIVREYPELQAAQQAAVVFRVRNLKTAAKMADIYAPEHLSLQVKTPQKWLSSIRRVGAVFLGVNTAQAMGDYTAGPNHVLPTGQTARWSSPLSVRDFERYTSVIEYTPAGMRKEGPAAIAVAEGEGLKAHANSIRQRISEK